MKSVIEVDNLFEYIKDSILTGKATPVELIRTHTEETENEEDNSRQERVLAAKTMFAISYKDKNGNVRKIPSYSYVVFSDEDRGALDEDTYGIEIDEEHCYKASDKSKEETLEEALDALGEGYVRGKDGQILCSLFSLTGDDVDWGVLMKMEEAGIRTVHDLTRHSEYEILRDVRYYKVKREIDKIKEKLAKQGLSLAPEKVKGRTRLRYETQEDYLKKVLEGKKEELKELEARAKELPDKIGQAEDMLREHREKMKQLGIEPVLTPEEAGEVSEVAEEFTRQARADKEAELTTADEKKAKGE